MISVKPVFNRLNIQNKYGLYTVNIRITIQRKQRYLTIKGFPKLMPDQWDNRQLKVKPTHHSYIELNKMLNNALQSIEQYIFKCLADDITPTFDMIKKHYTHSGFNNSFNSFIREHIMRNTSNLGTYKKYNTLANHIDNYNKDIRFSHINEAMISDFNRYLEKKGIVGNSRKKMFVTLKYWTTEASRQGLMQHQPFLFDYLKIKTTTPQRTTLTTAEIQRILTTPITDTDLHRHRLHFAFLCLTGLYYSDFRELTAQDITNTAKGLILSNERIKTQTTYIIPLWLFPDQMHIYNQIADTTGAQLFPGTISDQKFNLKLKQIAQYCNIDKNITNKTARHSFTDLLISKGVPRQYVSKILGHVKEATTEHYYRLNVAHVMENVPKINL